MRSGPLALADGLGQAMAPEDSAAAADSFADPDPPGPSATANRIAASAYDALIARRAHGVPRP